MSVHIRQNNFAIQIFQISFLKNTLLPIKNLNLRFKFFQAVEAVCGEVGKNRVGVMSCSLVTPH
jgi:hypothetical protein